MYEMMCKNIETIDRATAILADKIVSEVKPDEALKYTQAMLNLAHVKGMLVAEYLAMRKQQTAAQKP